MRIKGALAVSAIFLTACASLSNARVETQDLTAGACKVGIYGDADPFVVIVRSEAGFDYSISDGRRGSVGDGRVECGVDVVKLDQAPILKQRAMRITNTEFDSAGTPLRGQLIEPLGANSESSLVVLAHGSEESGWIESVAYPYQFVGRGVSVFVYDKRGTGQSAGAYSQNFPQLADDLVAASTEAKKLAGERFGRFGLFGFSQGGWIVPLAAKRAEAEFLGVGYGLVIDILEEDAAQVELELREAGYEDDVIAKAKTLTDVTARLAVSGYKDGLEELDELRERYKDEDWFPIIRGGFSGVLLGMSTTELRENGIPVFDRLNIDWSLKPMDVLREVDVPLLWILAEDDREAPISKTLTRLKTLREGGQEIYIYLYPDTDHGMWEYDQAADRTRTYTRVTATYYDLLADWAKGDLSPPYARSVEH